MKNLVVVMDWQNAGFPKDAPKEFAQEIEYAQRAVKNTIDIVNAAHENGDDVLWVAYCPEAGDIKSALGDGPCGICPDLKKLIRNDDAFFVKNESNAYAGISKTWTSNFGQTLQEYNKIIFTGNSVIDCIEATVKQAIKEGLGHKVLLARDACSPSPEFQGCKDSNFLSENNIKAHSTELTLKHIKGQKSINQESFNAATERKSDNSNQDLANTEQGPRPMLDRRP